MQSSFFRIGVNDILLRWSGLITHNHHPICSHRLAEELQIVYEPCDDGNEQNVIFRTLKVRILRPLSYFCVKGF